MPLLTTITTIVNSKTEFRPFVHDKRGHISDKEGSFYVHFTSIEVIDKLMDSLAELRRGLVEANLPPTEGDPH